MYFDIGCEHGTAYFVNMFAQGVSAITLVCHCCLFYLCYLVYITLCVLGLRRSAVVRKDWLSYLGTATISYVTLICRHVVSFVEQQQNKHLDKKNTYCSTKQHVFVDQQQVHNEEEIMWMPYPRRRPILSTPSRLAMFLKS